jgi:hypothetical protein
MTSRQFTSEEARGIGEKLGVDWHKTILEELRMGLSVELEHELLNPKTNLLGGESRAVGVAKKRA